MDSEELLKHKEKIARQRRTFALAKAIIRRGRNAGIPEQFIRIKQEEFEQLLCTSYHKDTTEFANLVYKSPEVLFQRPYIVIDGGDAYSRKKAGYAILFRMIACDSHGLSERCGELASKFQSLSFKDEENRNQLVKRIKKEPVLLLHEFRIKSFSLHLTDSGLFFDQLLSFRDDYRKPTIITFATPLSNGVINTESAIKDDRCGAYLAMISHADVKKSDKVFRIRLK